MYSADFRNAFNLLSYVWLGKSEFVLSQHCGFDLSISLSPSSNPQGPYHAVLSKLKKANMDMLGKFEKKNNKFNDVLDGYYSIS